jgi:uncharacterized membrane protein YedE/YeeE
MLEFLSQPWPWYVAGPIIGLLVPVLLLLGNRHFGFSSNFRHVCAAVAPGKVDFFRYDWRGAGLWNLTFLAGTLLGAFLASRFGIPEVQIADATRVALTDLGISDFSGLVPGELFNWSALGTIRGVGMMLGGGALVGFGTAWAGGCTSGHAIMGLASLERASLIAVVGFFVGGLAGTFLLLPVIL